MLATVDLEELVRGQALAPLGCEEPQASSGPLCPLLGLVGCVVALSGRWPRHSLLVPEGWGLHLLTTLVRELASLAVAVVHVRVSHVFGSSDMQLRQTNANLQQQPSCFELN